MMLDILGRCHLITVFESAVKRSETFKTHRQRNIQHGHIAFDQQKRRLPAADSSQIFDHGAAQVIVEQPGKAAFAVTEMPGQMLHADRLLIIVL